MSKKMLRIAYLTVIVCLLLPQLATGADAASDTIPTRWIYCDGLYHSCPAKCFCEHMDSIFIDIQCTNLTKNDLKDMRLPEHTKKLTLEYNNYKVIPYKTQIHLLPDNFVTACYSMDVLDLQWCDISQISRYAFIGLSNFSGLLDLRYNPLNYDSGSLPKGTFKHLTRLRSLRFLSFLLTTVTEYPEGLFNYMPHLQELSLDIIPDVIMKPVVFFGINSIDILSFNVGYANITSHTFNALGNISISQFNLTLVAPSPTLPYASRISQDALAKLQITNTLTFFLISIDFNHLTKIISKLSNRTRIDTLVVGTVLGKDIETSLTVKASFFKALERFNITRLSLTGCSIAMFDGVVPAYLPNLEKLDVSMNSLSIDTLLTSLSYWRHPLRTIYACDQGPAWREMETHLELYNYCHKPSMGVKYRSGKKRDQHLVKCDDTYILGENVEEISFMGTQATFMTSSVQLWGNTVCLGGPTHLSFLDLSRNYNPINAKLCFPDVIYQGEMTLDLSDNKIEDNLDLFACGDVLGALYLQGTELGSLLNDGESVRYFQNATELKLLDLSRNNIVNLHRDVFIKQTLLETLSLGSNSLQEVNFAVAEMPHLQHVDFSHNLLTSLPKSFTNELNEIVVIHSVRVTLHFNPLSCTCETLEFLQWVVRTAITVELPAACAGGSVVQERFIYLQERIIPNLNIQCESLAWIVATSVSVAVSMLLVTVSIALAYHIEHVRYLLWRLVWKNGQQRSSRQSKEDKYGVYVAYARSAGVDSLDVNWTRQELVPRLLTKYGEERVWFWEEFPYEEPVVKSIEDGVRNSSRFILVLSSNLQTFLHNDYLSHILIAMHLRCQEERRNLVTIVKLETVKTVDMPELLHHMCRSRQPLYWSPSRVEEFWERLTENLNECPPGYAYGVRCENCSSEVLINASAPRLDYGSIETSVRVS